ncbi:glycosyltransferase [Ursidibacter sp. B-7004-1]
MKVLIVHKWLVSGGVERILINYLNIFINLDYKVDLLIKYDLGGNHNVMEYLIPKEVNYKFLFDNEHFKKVSSSNKKNNLLFKIKREILKLKDNYILERVIKSECHKNNYDVIIDFSECLDKVIRYSNFIKDNNLLVFRWIHGQLNLDSHKKKIKYQSVFSHHYKVISICNQMKERVIEQLEYKLDNIMTIHNPIDFSELRKLSDSNLENINKELLEEKYILQVSRLVNGKGHFELLEIYSKLKLLGIKHKLYFIGDGENRNILENKIKELGLSEDCLLLGEIKNPYSYFKNADLFIHTSESEGLPTVLLESMALGVPVVAMDCPTGPKDILGANSEYGKLIPMHNKEMFIDAVLELLNNDELRQYYSRQSLIRVQDFSSEKISQQIDSLFKQVILEHHKKNELPKS